MYKRKYEARVSPCVFRNESKHGRIPRRAMVKSQYGGYDFIRRFIKRFVYRIDDVEGVDVAQWKGVARIIPMVCRMC